MILIAQETTHSEGDYELVPLTPLRKLEKKMETLESSKALTNMERFMDKVIDMVELNQKLVDDVVESNQGLREDLGIMLGKMDALTDKIDEFVTMIKHAAEHEEGGHITKEVAETLVTPLVQKMEEGQKREIETQTHMIEALDNIEKRLKRLNMPSSESATGGPGLLARRRNI